MTARRIRRQRALLFLLLVAATACGADEAPPRQTQWTGYLFDACPWAAFPAVTALGEGCQLDVFLSVGAPQGTVCAEAPALSLCSLDRLGHEVDPTRFVVLDGEERTLLVCAAPDKDPASEPLCEERPVFVPSAVRSVEGRTGATR